MGFFTALSNTLNLATSAAPSVQDSNWPYTLNNPNFDASDRAAWEMLLDGDSGRNSASGIRVTHSDALTFGPIMRAVKILGGDISCSVLNLERFQEDVKPGDSLIDHAAAVQHVVSLQWNETTSAAAGWERYVQEAGVFGTSYAWIQRRHEQFETAYDFSWAPVTGLYHLNPLVTHPKTCDETGMYGSKETGQLYLRKGEQYYETVVGHRTVYLRWNEVLEFPLFRGMPLPMLRVYRDVVGMALAAQGFQSKFFANGAQAGGFISVPPGTTPDSAKNLQGELRRRQATDSWFRVHILRDGAKFHQLTVDPKSTEMGQINERAARLVADFYNLNPMKMGLPGSDSYGAGESSRIDHVTGCLNRHFTQIQGECYVKLLSPRVRRAQGPERRRFVHDFSGLVEPDWTTRVENACRLRDAAVFNANDVLTELKRPQRTDPQAEEYFNPSTAAKDLDGDTTTAVDDSPSETDESDDVIEADNRPLKRVENHQENSADDSAEPQQTEEAAVPSIPLDRIKRAAVEGPLQNLAAAVANRAKNRARSDDKFKDFLSSGFGDTRPWFTERITETVSLWNTEPGSVLAVAEKQFFDGLMDDLIHELTQTEDTDPIKARRKAVTAALQRFLDTRLDGVINTLIS